MDLYWIVTVPHPSPTSSTTPRAQDTSGLTVVTTCRGRLHHLRQSLPLIVAQPGLHCIVVDYGCPDHTGDWVQRHFPSVKVVRVPAGGPFSISRARNLGAMQAQTAWLCFLDADTLVGPDFHNDVGTVLRDGHFFLADPCPHELAGLVVCRREDFSRIEGYDEIFAGWGCEDRDLYARLGRIGCTQSQFPAHGVRVISHGDDERMRNYDVADRFVSLRVNGMYFQIKNDLARLINKTDLMLADRQELYARIRQRVLADPQAAARMDVTLPAACDFRQPPGWQLRRTISYSFEPLMPFPP